MLKDEIKKKIDKKTRVNPSNPRVESQEQDNLMESKSKQIIKLYS
jgi:hypothetical protein